MYSLECYYTPKDYYYYYSSIVNNILRRAFLFLTCFLFLMYIKKELLRYLLILINDA